MNLAFFGPKMAVSWRRTAFQKKGPETTIFIVFFVCALFGPSCQKREILDTQPKKKKIFTDNWKAHFWVFFVFSCFFVFFFFLFLFFLVLLFFLLCFFGATTSLGPKPSLFVFFFVFFFFASFPFFVFNRKNPVFPPKKGIFLVYFQCFPFFLP